MALALASSRPVRPRYELTVGRARLAFYLGDCVEVLPHLERGSIRAVVTSPPYNIGVQVPDLPGRPAPPRVSELERALAPRGRRRRRSARVAVSQRRRQADGPVDSAGSRAGRARAFPPAEHDSLGEVDRHRPRSRGTRGRPRARRRRRSLQADQQRALRERLPRVHLPLHARWPDAARSARHRGPLSGPVKRQSLGRCRRRQAVPRQHLVHSVRHDSEPRPRPAAPGVVSA